MRAKRDVGEERGLAKTRNFKKSQMIQTYASKYYKQLYVVFSGFDAALHFMHADGWEG